jgi:hypothetical protein
VREGGTIPALRAIVEGLADEPKEGRRMSRGSCAALLSAALAIVGFVSRPAEGRTAPAGTQLVERAELAEAMRTHGDYDLAATTNGPRFQAEVFFWLARRALAAQPQGCRLFIPHEDWFEVFLEVANLRPEQAALPSRLVYENGQDIELDCRPERVIRRVTGGRQARLALNVKFWWEKTANPKGAFGYLDTASTPVLKVTNNRVITYRLVDLGDQILFDDIRGLTGRPTTGFLGLLFKLIGEGRIVKTQIAYAPDGVQVSRVVAQKFFSRTVTVVTWPNGKTESEIPAQRQDLAALKQRLDQPVEIEYQPLDR